jgi:hypothetical protein
MGLCSLEQIKFLSPADCCPSVVHPKLAVNVFGVSMQGIQGHNEFAGNFRAVQVGSEQPQYFKLTLPPLHPQKGASDATPKTAIAWASTIGAFAAAMERLNHPTGHPMAIRYSRRSSENTSQFLSLLLLVGQQTLSRCEIYIKEGICAGGAGQQVSRSVILKQPWLDLPTLPNVYKRFCVH